MLILLFLVNMEIVYVKKIEIGAEGRKGNVSTFLEMFKFRSRGCFFLFGCRFSFCNFVFDVAFDEGEEEKASLWHGRSV